MKEMYLITRLDAICCVIESVVIISVLALLIFTIWVLIEKADTTTTELPKWLRRTFIATVIIAVLSVTLKIAIPTTKEACAIYVVGGVIDNDEDAVKELPTSAVKFANEYMKEQIKGIKK